MESEFNLSTDLCEKILTIYLLELNQTSKVNPAEKYYFKNLNQILKVPAQDFKRNKTESAAYRPPVPQDRMIDLKVFFQETQKTLACSYPQDQVENLLKFILVSMDCSSHFTLESLDQLIQENTSSSNLQVHEEKTSPIIEEDSDFFSPIEEESPFDIIEESADDFRYIDDEEENLLPPSVTGLSSATSIDLPKSNLVPSDEPDETIVNESNPDLDVVQDTKLAIEENLTTQQSSEETEESSEPEGSEEKPSSSKEMALKKKKFSIPKVSIDTLVKPILKVLEKPSDLIIDKLNLSIKEDQSYAPPKVRVIASLIDSFLLFFALILMIPVQIIFSTLGLGIVANLLGLLLNLLIVFYYFKMETSTYQGSIGKVLCKIKIVNENNQMMDTQQALKRSLFKFVPIILTSLLTIIHSFISIAPLFMIPSLLSFLVFLGMCYLFIQKQHRGLHDIFAKCFVIGVNHDLPKLEEVVETKEKPSK